MEETASQSSYLCSVDIMAFIKDTPPPATVVLISGDRDFAYLLSTVRWRKYNVVLISNSFMTHESLTIQASVAYDWRSDVLKLQAQPPTKPPVLGSQFLSPAASLTTPQEFHNLPEPDAHPVGHSIVRVAPSIQPLTLSPHSASAATVNTVRPRRATLPPDPPSVESEAMPIPPEAGSSAEARPASIPMDPTPDDWIEADSTGGSTAVHPSIVHGVAVDLVFNRTLSHPKQPDRLMRTMSTLLRS